MFDSGVYAHKARLLRHLERGEINEDVVAELIPNGAGLPYEKSLWDYKAELPTLPRDRTPSEAEKDVHAAKMAAIVKDAVSFYNCHGGYIVVGVDDLTRKVVGFEKHFSVEDLQKKAHVATGHNIDCHYALHTIGVAGDSKTVGILLIPRRLYSESPAQFRRNAPKYPGSEALAYRSGDIYLRSADECRPARTADDYSFLCGDARRERSIADEFRNATFLLNNVGHRDPGFIQFVGRESYLRELWRWVCDGFTPIKLLTGIGGVGKTTLAREFSEDFIRNPPKGFAKLIWLSAKKRLYIAVEGNYQPTSRVDFSDTNSLLRAILSELATPSELMDTEWTVPELAKECIRSLQLFPSLLVVDDVDSLDPLQQQETFQTIIQIAAQTIGRSGPPSLALMTSRLDLGAAPRQLLHITGLEEADFLEYINVTATNLRVPLTLKANSQLFKNFHKMTDGSPTFAASVLGLMQNGLSLDTVLKKYKGYDGDMVRQFAFERELNQLSDSQIRTLYSASLLGETSFAELEKILQSNERRLNDDLGALRKYHLVSLGEELPGGAKIVIPSSIVLLTDLIAKRITDPRRLARLCARAQHGTTYMSSDVGGIIRRVSALWHTHQSPDALQAAEVAIVQFPDHPDLECLLGRAHLEIDPPDYAQAEVHLRKAHALKCARPELPDLWIKAKSLGEDWVGLLESCKVFGENSGTIVARATAFFELGMIAVRGRNIESALSQWSTGYDELNRALSGVYLRNRMQEARKLQKDLIENIVRASDSIAASDYDRFPVWMVGIKAMGIGVRSHDVIAISCSALIAWWDSVEKRHGYADRAHKTLDDQIERLGKLIAGSSRDETIAEPALQILRATRDTLHLRSQKYPNMAYEFD